MSRILLDTNVLLDVLLDRKPHAGSSALVFAAVETGRVEAFLAAHAVTTIHYLIRREMTAAQTRRVIVAILNLLKIAPVDGSVIAEALQSASPDFEHAVTAAAARAAGCDYVVTRDPKGFRASHVRPLTPEAILPLLEATGE